MPQRSVEGSRLHVIVPDRQRKALEELVDHTGFTMSDHIRRAIDQYLAAQKEK